MNKWHLTARPMLSFRDRVRLLFGVPLFVRFTSPDGDCHAACTITAMVQKHWPADDLPGGWPPLPRPIPPMPTPPPRPTGRDYGSSL